MDRGFRSSTVTLLNKRYDLSGVILCQSRSWQDAFNICIRISFELVTVTPESGFNLKKVRWQPNVHKIDWNSCFFFCLAYCTFNRIIAAPGLSPLIFDASTFRIADPNGYSFLHWHVLVTTIELVLMFFATQVPFQPLHQSSLLFSSYTSINSSILVVNYPNYNTKCP